MCAENFEIEAFSAILGGGDGDPGEELSKLDGALIDVMISRMTTPLVKEVRADHMIATIVGKGGAVTLAVARYAGCILVFQKIAGFIPAVVVAKDMASAFAAFEALAKVELQKTIAMLRGDQRLH
jgi:hypothetical protein